MSIIIPATPINILIQNRRIPALFGFELLHWDWHPSTCTAEGTECRSFWFSTNDIKAQLMFRHCARYPSMVTMAIHIRIWSPYDVELFFGTFSLLKLFSYSVVWYICVHLPSVILHYKSGLKKHGHWNSKILK